MTDDDRRAAIDASLQQWVAAQITKHPAALVRERIAKAADDYRRDMRGEQTTSERLRDAIDAASPAMRRQVESVMGMTDTPASPDAGEPYSVRSRESAAQAACAVSLGSDPKMPIRPSAGRVSSRRGK